MKPLDVPSEPAHRKGPQPYGNGGAAAACAFPFHLRRASRGHGGHTGTDVAGGLSLFEDPKTLATDDFLRGLMDDPSTRFVDHHKSMVPID